jgi:hypothetical protein
MHAHNNRAGRFTARLGLESLESRTLLSTTLPTPSGVLGTALVGQAAPMAVQQSALTTAHFSYNWSVTPGPVVTGTNTATVNHHSSGVVMFAQYHTKSTTAKVGGSAVGTPIAVITTISSATDAHPDHFNRPMTLTLKIRDASGASTTVTFKGMLTGTLSWDRSSLKLTFPTSQLRKVVKVGTHEYTITLKTATLSIPRPGSGTPALLGASIHVSNAPRA